MILQLLIALFKIRVTDKAMQRGDSETINFLIAPSQAQATFCVFKFIQQRSPCGALME